VVLSGTGSDGSAGVYCWNPFRPPLVRANAPVSRTRMQGRDLQILRLKQQLGDARHRYVDAMEDHQASREESQNTTEEALSANEEMQSLNEELETAKEELQSINEELITINDELQARNAAPAQARDFAMSIVETVRQPLLVLDTDLHIGEGCLSFKSQCLSRGAERARSARFTSDHFVIFLSFGSKNASICLLRY
jgi:hypothetical protein